MGRSPLLHPSLHPSRREGGGRNSHSSSPCQPTQPERSSSPLSQLSAADADVIRASGLGIENMGAEEFEALMDVEGEEIEYVPREHIGKEGTGADTGGNGHVDMLGVGGVEQWDRE